MCVCWKMRCKLLCRLQEKIKRKGRTQKGTLLKQDPGEGQRLGSGAQKRKHISSSVQMIGPLPVFLAPLPTPPDILPSKHSISLSDHATLSQALMVLHILFPPPGMLVTQLSRVEFWPTLQIQLIDPCHWEIFLILHLSKVNASSLVFRLVRYTFIGALILTSHQNGGALNKKDCDTFKQITCSRNSSMNEQMNGKRENH